MSMSTSLSQGGVTASSKLLNASRSVQHMVRANAALSTPRAPGLSAAASSEDYDELFRRNDEYYKKLQASRADTFSNLGDMVDALSKRLGESTQACNDLVLRMQELDELIDGERRKWKSQNEQEKSRSIMGQAARGDE